MGCGKKRRPDYETAIAAATEGPRMWAEPDPFGEPTIWHEVAGAPQPVLAKSDLSVGSRHLWRGRVRAHEEEP